MKSSNTKERILYSIDNIMARGSFSIIIALAFVVILLILVLSIFIWSIGSNPSLGFIDQFWVYFNKGFGREAAEGNWTYRLTTFLLVIVSIFFSSIIIGSIANSISSKITELREGKSKVIESNHTVILGWSESVYIIINEIIEANKSQKSGCIVVLGDKRATKMNFPTANIIPPNLIHPKKGVYIIKAIYEGIYFNGVANFGVRPTVDGEKLLLEVHLFNFNSNLYGKDLTVEFLAFIRDEQQFESFEELKKQINRDIKKAQSYHSKY